MLTAVFQDMAVGTYSSGVTRWCHGEYIVMVDEIPPNAPQDWELGPTMKPGEFGAFLANDLHPRGHSPYAICTGKNADEARGKAGGYFRKKLIEWSDDMEQREGRAGGNLAWARYEESTRTLEVDFRGKDGQKLSTYSYGPAENPESNGVSPEVWAQFRTAAEPGKFFAAFIRPKYKGRKL